MIKRALMAAALAAAFAAPAAAQQAGQLGVGVLLGDPTAASVKYFVTNAGAVDFGLGVSNNLVLHADWVQHLWNLKPQPSKGQLGLYGGIGPRLEFEDHTDFGIRLMPGMSYWPKIKQGEFEFFLEIGPVIRLTEGTRVTVDGGFGARYYFQTR